MHVLRYDDLRGDGLSPRAIMSATRTGRLVRLRPDVYVDGGGWAASPPEERIIARARGLHVISSTPPVFSHETAAAIRGLPLFRPDRERVHVIAAEKRPGAASAVIRHRGTIADGDVEEVDGLLCTTLARTVADVARTASFE